MIRNNRNIRSDKTLVGLKFQIPLAFAYAIAANESNRSEVPSFTSFRFVSLLRMSLIGLKFQIFYDRSLIRSLFSL